MTKQIIGIVGNQLIQAVSVFHGNYVTYTPQGFVNALQAVGGVPLIIPIGKKELAAFYVKQIDKLLLTGGQDVAPRYYGEQPHPKLGENNNQRDEFELALIQEALLQKKPILAVCRGMQLLNVAFGGSLYQDLSLYADWQIKHNQDPTQGNFATHTIKNEPNSLVQRVFGDSTQVNSYHHQAVKKLGTGLKATAWSDDGIIEAIESADSQQQIIGVQWHPELNFLEDPQEKELFRYFVHEL
jgi:putative glutamine amidotransferase